MTSQSSIYLVAIHNVNWKKKMLIRRTDSSFVMLSYSKPSFRSLGLTSTKYQAVAPQMILEASLTCWLSTIREFPFAAPAWALLRHHIFKEAESLAGRKVQSPTRSFIAACLTSESKWQRSEECVFFGGGFQMTWSFPPKVLLKPLVASCRWSSNISNQG